ncbi:hypothetical protein [Nocardia sp. NPDC004750]
MTEAFSDALDPTRFAPRMVCYSGGSLEGRAALAREIAKSPDPVIIAGYAQGAAVVGDFAAGAGLAGSDSGVIGCALISDPFRPRGRVVNRDPGGHGLLGEREVDGIPAFWVAAEGDLTTALAGDSGLRMIPELFEYLDLCDEEEMIGWGRKIIDALLREQLARYPFARRVWHNRGAELSRVSRHLFTTAYIDNYIKLGLVSLLAEVMSGELSDRG